MRTETFLGGMVGDRAALECTGCGLLEGTACADHKRDEGGISPRQLANVFGDGVLELVRAVQLFLAEPSVLSIRVSETLGLALGARLDGATLAVMTEAGMVRVEVEPDPRRSELTIAALRRALGDAVAQIDEHNCEHDYVTPYDKLARWRKLAEGDPR